MDQTKFQGNPVALAGALPQVGTPAPDFTAVKNDLSELTLSSLKGKKVVLNIFPSVDTGVCAASVRRFNKEAAGLNNVAVLCISEDLPFAHGRFCAAEGIENVTTLSDFRYRTLADVYGLRMADGPLSGLLARAIIIIDETGKVIYTQLVPEVTNDPNFDEALAQLK